MRGMGTIQDPRPDRDWLKRTYPDTSTNPYSVDARTEMLGRLAEGTGRSRTVMRAVVVITLVTIAASIALGVLGLLPVP